VEGSLFTTAIVVALFFVLRRLIPQSEVMERSF